MYGEEHQHHSPLNNIMGHLQTMGIVGHDLFSEGYLNPETMIASQNGAYYAKLQEDGNFCIYVGTHHMPKNAIWNTRTYGKGSAPYSLAMQSDGNLVLYDSNQEALWNTHTNDKGTGPYRVVMQNNGDLVLFDSEGTQLWHSDTVVGSK